MTGPRYYASLHAGLAPIAALASHGEEGSVLGRVEHGWGDGCMARGAGQRELQLGRGCGRWDAGAGLVRVLQSHGRAVGQRVSQGAPQ